MAGHDRRLHSDAVNGEEASPSPLKSRRLVEMMDESSPKSGRPSSASSGAAYGADESASCMRGHSDGDKTPPLSPGKTAVLRSGAPRRAEPTACGNAPFPDPVPPADIPPDGFAVLSVTPAGEGETVQVVMAQPSPEGGRHQRVSFYLLVEQYAELDVKTGIISTERAEDLLDAGRLCGAIRRGIAMLGYGDQSARRLACKLTVKGVDRGTAERAVAYLTERGYIREEDTATLRARQGVGKGWGERRIREDLCAHGFTREAVEEAILELSDVDWEENCAAAIRKKYREIPEDRGDRQKLVAAMMRLGYDADTVKAAVRMILREN